jgi:hypothetical protein
MIKPYLLRNGALALVMVAAACTSPTPYRPVTPGSNQTGYSSLQIERDRFRVSFAGNSMTSRDTVERYLLFRAAELTLEQGYDWFTMADRNTERRSRTYVDRPFSAGDCGYWGPAWRYRSSRFGWRSWDPFWGDPFWDNSIDVRTVDQYEATAEIIVGRGPKPGGDRRAFDARDVIERLRNTIQPG